MKYPDGDTTFIPEATGQVVNIDPDNPVHRAIVGDGVADKIKEIQSRPKYDITRWVQVVQPKRKKP